MTEPPRTGSSYAAPDTKPTTTPPPSQTKAAMASQKRIRSLSWSLPFIFSPLVAAFHEAQPQAEIIYDLTKGSPPIRLAYAQTVHKSQGQEYDVIVVPMLSSFGRQLQRNLLYTAITRAKKRVVIVGNADAVRRAVRNNRANKRNTLLSYRLGGSAQTPFGY